MASRETLDTGPAAVGVGRLRHATRAALGCLPDPSSRSANGASRWDGVSVAGRPTGAGLPV